MFIVVYLNNILVYSKTYEEHVQYIHQVLTILRDTDLCIKVEKTEFHK
jgi:hypothetical protein